MAAHDSDPSNPPCGKTPPNAMAFFFGSVEATSTNSSVTILKLDGEDVLSFEKTFDGIYINATIRDRQGNQVASLTKNVFRALSENGYYSLNPDSSTLVVIDPKDQKALYVRYMNPTSVKIQAIFHSKRGGRAILGEEHSPFCYEMRDAGVLVETRPPS
jgi:hypothetical protein